MAHTVADELTDAEKTFYLSKNEVAVDSETKTISATLSQEDTLSFKSKTVQVQIRAKDNSDLTYATEIISLSLSQILKGGVIE